MVCGGWPGEARETSLRREVEEGERRIKEQQMLLEEALARLKVRALKRRVVAVVVSDVV